MNISFQRFITLLDSFTGTFYCKVEVDCDSIGFLSVEKDNGKPIILIQYMFLLKSGPQHDSLRLEESSIRKINYSLDYNRFRITMMNGDRHNLRLLTANKSETVTALFRLYHQAGA